MRRRTIAIFVLSVCSIFTTTWLWSAPLALLAEDPYATQAQDRLGKIKMSVDLRVINHGVQVNQDYWRRQLNGIEQIYSQCAGIDFRVRIVGMVDADETHLSETMLKPQGGIVYLTQDFLDFFQPWKDSRPPQSIDVHLVNYLSAGDRARYEANPLTAQGGNLGQAFHAMKLDRDYRYYAGVDGPTPSSIAGNSVVLASDSSQKSEEHATGTLFNDLGPGLYFSRDPSLLAHEVGHLLMNFDLLDSNGDYIGHACPGVRDICPSHNFLSPGGSPNFVVYENDQLQRGKLLGFSSLADIEPEQCALLKAHPLVRWSAF